MSMILWLILLFNCHKNININKYNSKEYNSKEENSSKEENKPKKENKEKCNLEKIDNNKSEEDIKGQNLIEAIISKDKVRVKEALKEGANVNYKGFHSEWEHPLIFAVSNYDKSIVETLLDAGANGSKIPILTFIKDDRFSIKSKFKFLKLLIKKGHIDVNAKDDKNRTLINSLCCTDSYFYLIGLNESKILELLISKGADLNAQDIYGNTPLLNLVSNLILNLENENFYYLYTCSEKIIEKIIKFGADINVKNYDGNTALILAAKIGEPNLIEILLKLNFDIHAKNNLGEDVLIAFVKKVLNPSDSYYYLTLKGIIRKLIKFGADINVKDNDGNTALILAAKSDEMTLVKVLLKLNANIHIRNDLGEDALIVAVKKIGSDIFKCREELSIFKNLLKFSSPDLTNIDLILKSLSEIKGSYLLKKIWGIIFDDLKFVKAFIYEDNRPNIARILQIQNLNIDKKFKNKIIKKIDETISLSHSSIFEKKELLLEKLLSYDSFIFENKGLLIDAFLNIIKLYKLKGENKVKEINELLVNSLSDYYNDKLNNQVGYEERFLKEIRIIRAKINIFVTNLYNKIKDSRNNNNY